jgi:hypothetical protein
MNQLRTCPHCSRHHRVCEPMCPFCGGALPACEAASETTRRGRMSRAMLVAAGAALLGGAQCDSVMPPYGTPPHVPTPDASTNPSDAAQLEKAGAANAANENSRGDDADAVDGGPASR